MRGDDVPGRCWPLYLALPHLIDEEAEASRAEAACPKSPCRSAAEPELDLLPGWHVTLRPAASLAPCFFLKSATSHKSRGFDGGSRALTHPSLLPPQ